MHQDLEYSGEESYDSMYDEEGLYDDGEAAGMAAQAGGAPGVASRATTGSDTYG